MGNIKFHNPNGNKIRKKMSNAQKIRFKDVNEREKNININISFR